MKHIEQPNLDGTEGFKSEDPTKFVISPSGARIDTSSTVWRIGVAEVLNWMRMPLVQGGEVLTATQRYFRTFITRSNPRYILGQFYWLKAVFAAALHMRFDVDTASQYDMNLYEAVRNHLREHVDTQLGILNSRRSRTF